jgi:bifunctional enzyme CysN/CysC
MHDHEMLAGRSYLLKLGTAGVGAAFSQPKYKVNVNTLEHLAARTLGLNEIGVCTVTLDRLIPFDPYSANRDMGGFVVIDRMSNATVGAGLLRFSLRRSQNVHWQALEVDAEARSALKRHNPAVVWFTGISGAGKSTIANLAEQLLHSLGVHTYLLDGDNIRHGLNRDLGFTDLDRIENIRRVAEVAKLMADAGLVVLASFISPFRAERLLARELAGEGRFCEVFVDTSIEMAEARDRKGLYRKARQGELKNFTGIDSPYEVPSSAELVIDTSQQTPEEAAELLLVQLRGMGLVP